MIQDNEEKLAAEEGTSETAWGGSLVIDNYCCVNTSYLLGLQT